MIRDRLSAETIAEIERQADAHYEARPGSPLTPALAEQIRRTLPRPAERREAA
jgi:hypothetical protein